METTRYRHIKIKTIPEVAGMWQFRFHLASLVLLALATLWPKWFYYPAALLFAIAQAALLFNLSRAVRFYNVKVVEFSLQQTGRKTGVTP